MYVCATMSDNLFDQNIGSWRLDCMNLGYEATREWLNHGFIELSLGDDAIAKIQNYYKVDLSDCDRVEKRYLQKGESVLILNANGLNGTGKATLCQVR